MWGILIHCHVLSNYISFFPFQDIEYIETVYEKMFKLVERGGDKKLKPEYDTICKIRSMLMEEEKQVRFADWDTKEVSYLSCTGTLIVSMNTVQVIYY